MTGRDSLRKGTIDQSSTAAVLLVLARRFGQQTAGLSLA